MHEEEAKLILQVYRPDGSDATDPLFSAALDEVRINPPLAAWFEWQREIDRRISLGFRGIRPPVGLQASILYGCELSKSRENWRTRLRRFGFGMGRALFPGESS
jgi:hypothetical protein